MMEGNEWETLPTIDKVEHKVWKARLKGYEECITLFSQESDKSPEFAKYAGVIKKFPVDMNECAKEKGLEAVLIFLENAAIAKKVVNEIMSGIVSKCLTSRAKTKELAMNIILMCVEIEKPDVVQEELLKGLENKQPKIVQGCLEASRKCLNDFGYKVFPIKPILPAVMKLLDHRDGNVRDEAKQVLVQIYQWIGSALKPQLEGIKPVVLSELENEFEKVSNVKIKPVRYLRSEKPVQEEAVVENAEEVVNGPSENVEDETIDPFDFMEPVEVLSKLPSDFYEKIESKQWKERREVLDICMGLTEKPKFSDGDYSSLCKALRKVVSSDTNVLLVISASKCLCRLAKGLRKMFNRNLSYPTIEVCLERTKERKANVVEPLKEAADAAYDCDQNLEAIAEMILPLLAYKVPYVRQCTAQFLTRCFSMLTAAKLTKKLIKMYITGLIKNLSEADPGVRESAAECIGVQLRIDEKAVKAFLVDLDPTRLNKVMEMSEKAVLRNTKGEPRTVAPPPVTAATNVAAPAASSLKVEEKAGQPNEPVAVKKIAGKPPAKNKAAKKTADKQNTASLTAVEPEIQIEAAEEIMLPLIGEEILSNLAHSSWKDRLAAVTSFLDRLKSINSKDIPCQAVVKVIGKNPGFKDSNFQVLKARIDIVTYIASASDSVFSIVSAKACIPDLVDKLSDLKNGMSVKEAFSTMSEACSMPEISSQVLSIAMGNKSPKVQENALEWFSTALKEFGSKGLDIKPIVKILKSSISHSNANIRNASISLIADLFLYYGSQIQTIFEDEKPSVVQQIESAIEKVRGQKPPAPIRKSKQSHSAVRSSDPEENASETEDSHAVADVVDRVNISDLITPELLEQLNDKNWKIRNEGLEKISSILRQNKFILPSLGDLPNALKQRLNDANKMLVIATLSICQSLAEALGPHTRAVASNLIPAIFQTLTDNKPNMRQAAVSALNVFYEKCGLNPFIEGDTIAKLLSNKNPCLKAETCGWLAEALGTAKKPSLSDLKNIVPCVYNCLEDRNPDVRVKSALCLAPLMAHVGYTTMVHIANSEKLSVADSKTSIMNALEKVRPNVVVQQSEEKIVKPQKPVKVALEKDTKEPEEEIDVPTKSEKLVKEDKEKMSNDTNAPFIKSSKEKRMEEEKSLKALKWVFDVPRKEFVDQLHRQMEPYFSRNLMNQFYSDDFKQHICAIAVLLKALDEHTEATVSNLDLILRWISLRLFENNSSVIIKAVDYLTNVISRLEGSNYVLSDFEASSIIPFLLLKVGDSKDSVRKSIRQVIHKCGAIYPPTKIFPFLLEGLKSKNSRQRAECLDEMTVLIENHGLNVCNPSPQVVVKEISKYISDRDNNVRTTALTFVALAHGMADDQVFRWIGKISEKSRSMIDERIKRTAKNKNTKVSASFPNSRSAAVTPTKEVSGRILQENNTPFTSMMKNHKSLLSFEEESLDYPQPVTLIEHKDLDEVLLPTTKLPPRINQKSLKPSVLKYSQDCRQLICLVIAGIADSDFNNCILSLAQIYEIICDIDKRELLEPHVDYLLRTCCIKLCLELHNRSVDFDEQRIFRLLKSIILLVTSLFNSDNLAQSVSRDSLKELLQNFLFMFFDRRLVDQDRDGNILVRALNLSILDIIKNSNPTHVFCALIRLLTESCANEQMPEKFIELVMKCLWRLHRMGISVISALDFSQVLSDINVFLKHFPPDWWQTRSDSLPFHTIKTLIHDLVKYKQGEILEDVAEVDQETEDLHSIIYRMLRSNSVLAEKSSANGKKPKKLSKETNEKLTEIFRKLGSKEHTKTGFEELYDFKMEHPEVSIEPYLQKSSQFFQTFIENGLRTVALERENVAHTPLDKRCESPLDFYESLQSLRKRSGLRMSTCKADILDSSYSNRNKRKNLEQFDPDAFINHLQQLRKQCGLADPPPNNDDSLDENEEIPRTVLKIHQPLTPTETSEVETKPHSANIEALRQRLARIKMSAGIE